jgi:acetyl esterase/lipase
MRRMALLLGLLILPNLAQAADGPGYKHVEDIIYGRKHGLALTLDVYTPTEKPNGLGVIFVVSGGWVSSHAGVSLALMKPLIDRGYTVFAVVHGSQPRYTIPEAIDDINRSVRFIRHHAKDYKIDPERIGIYGFSAGGHLSLVQGTTAGHGRPALLDAVERESSKVQAVAAFFPPTDFLDYGEPGHMALGTGVLKPFRAAFDFHEFHLADKVYATITDEEKRVEIGKKISPFYHVSHDSAPALLFHGDADRLVPIQQSELILGKFKDAGVDAKLVVKPGQGHGWPELNKDLPAVADWFDAHLKPKH